MNTLRSFSSMHPSESGSSCTYLWFCFSWLLVITVISTDDVFAVDETVKVRAESENESFLAGAAVLDITSPLGTRLVGSFRPTEAEHVNDPLNVRVLALNDGEKTLAIAVCDLLGVPQELGDHAKKLIEEQSNLSASQVVITGTHTHSAGSPYTRATEELNSYQLFLAKRIADAVQIAINNLEPAQIGFGSGSEPSQVFNRRWFVSDEDIRRNPFGGVDRVVMNPPNEFSGLIEPAGPTDPEISFLSVRSLDGQPISLLANYSLHYVGGIPRATISADYFGAFSDRIQELLGADRQTQPFVGIMTNGTSGDINNINYAAARETNEPYEKMHEVADLVAKEVYRAYQEIEYHDWVQLDARYDVVQMKRREISDEMISFAQNIVNNPEDAQTWHSHADELRYSNRLLSLSETPEIWDVPLQAFRIGDLGIAAIPAEVFVEIGLEIKERSPFDQTFTLSLANGSLGYLPTVEHHELGGYETWIGTNRMEIEAAPNIIDILMDFLLEMRN